MRMRQYSRFVWLLGQMPKNAVCAEIGVAKGRYSRRILEITQPKELHLIDPWIWQPKSERSQNLWDEMCKEVRNKFRSYENVAVHREMSEACLKRFPDNYFDWVYIDGDHSYSCVLSDLEICRLKVKPEGLLAGDDFLLLGNPDVPDYENFPVKRAVEFFLKKYDLRRCFRKKHKQYIIVNKK